MNIVFFTHYTELYGANRSLVSLADGLKKYGHIPFLISPKFGDITELFIEKDFKVLVYPYDYWLSVSEKSLENASLRINKQLENLNILKDQLVKWDIDLVYTNTSVIDIGIITAWTLGKPHIWHIREFYDLHYNYLPDVGHNLFKKILFSSDGMIFISKVLQNYYLHNQPYQKSKMVYNGVVDIDTIMNNLEIRRGAFNYQIRNFAMVGRIYPAKGYEIAIKALSLVVDKYPQIMLEIAGDGDIQWLKNLIEEYKLNYNVKILGQIANSFDLFLKSDAALMCSTNEAMGRVTVEAMACGIPVIGCNSGATSEIITNGFNGLLYESTAAELADKMISLIENLDRVNEFVKNGWKTVENNFTVEKYTSEINDYIAKVVTEFKYSPNNNLSIDGLVTEKETVLFEIYNKIYQDKRFSTNNYIQSANERNKIAKQLALDGKNDLAISKFEEMLVDFPDFFDANFNLGILYYQQNELKKSAKQYLKCLEIKLDDRNSVINCFHVLSELGKNDEAEKIVAAYLINNYEDVEMRKFIGISVDSVGSLKGESDNQNDIIAIATSLFPSGGSNQLLAYNSWLMLGFKVISFNCRAEIELLQKGYPAVTFIEVSRTAQVKAGKPLVYLDDILNNLQKLPYRYLGYVNSDVVLLDKNQDNEYLIESIKKQLDQGQLLYASRLDVESFEDMQGVEYAKGYDLFFFNRFVLAKLPAADYIIGLPWWDYYLLVAAVINGITLAKIDNPLLVHKKHEFFYKAELWYEFAEKMVAYLADNREKHSFEIMPRRELPEQKAYETYLYDLAGRIVDFIRSKSLMLSLLQKSNCDPVAQKQFEHLKNSWTFYGKDDSFWAVLTDPQKKGNKWNPEEFYRHGRNNIKGVLNRLASFDLKMNFGQTLDFGCGAGRLTQALALYFDQVYGVDISATMLETAEQYNQFYQKCRYLHNTEDNLSIFADNSLDLIVTIITLQHMKPKFIKKYLLEFIRILKPVGILVFQLPGRRIDFTDEQWRMHRASQDTKINSSDNPVMEMNGLEKEEIVAIFSENRCEIINVVDDGGLKPHWESNNYIIRKLS